MNHQKLSASLRETAGLIETDQIAEVDFKRLGTQLTTAAELLDAALTDRDVAAEMLRHFRHELRSRAQATARLSGRDSTLIERLIDSDELSVAELVLLRKQIDTEFDDAFSSTLTEPPPAARGDEKLAAFKS